MGMTSLTVTFMNVIGVAGPRRFVTNVLANPPGRRRTREPSSSRHLARDETCVDQLAKHGQATESVRDHMVKDDDQRDPAFR
jgi:hypothetical protein